MAHLNPVTNAHAEIIRDLMREADDVKVMPVVFRDGDAELNSRSFPFDYQTRRSMLESVFGDAVRVTDDYLFAAPFKKYMPPLLSGKSWSLRSSILRDVRGEYFSYTGDRAEGIMLKVYRLNPRVGRRKAISAASVKNILYEAASNGRSADSWEKYVPEQVAEIIRGRWEVVRRFADSPDETVRIMGMKFPKSGW